MPDDINSSSDMMGDINDQYSGTRMTHMAGYHGQNQSFGRGA